MLAKNAIEDGSALNKLGEMITAQGGNTAVIEDYSLFKQAKHKIDVVTQNDGFITHINAEKVGTAAVMLGAGREVKGDSIDSSAGIILKKKIGDRVCPGEVLASLFTDDKMKIESASQQITEAFEVGESTFKKQKLIYKIIK